MCPFGSMYTRPSPCIRNEWEVMPSYVLGGRQQPDHVRPAEDQRLAVPPALPHAMPTLRRCARQGLESRSMDREQSARRIENDIETLAGSDYTRSDEAIRRYAYTQEYRNTLGYFRRELEAIGFEVEEDPLGTLVARSRPKGEPVFGLGSHCDS